MGERAFVGLPLSTRKPVKLLIAFARAARSIGGLSITPDPGRGVSGGTKS